MIRFYPDEEFREIILEMQHRFRYALSNYGRLISYTDDLKKGTLLKGTYIDGYHVLRTYKQVNGVRKSKTLLLYKLVAEFFVPKTAEDQQHVIHIDYDKSNDRATNLRWVNHKEKMEHHKVNPRVIASQKKVTEFNRRADGKKLTETTVIRLKRILLDPNRKTRMKILAKQFGVSEMQLYRIKSGENWGHIKVNIRKKDEAQ
ncbi:NUMOD4 domain-containing protein [Flavobacterium saliperosum S13]|uniref:NUMOD4 motif-containing protein n=2 Tax=Flavobacterium saliperosum TaxID=329186 RepID=A0A1G4W7X4_9FLAO|nr:HNH endonuclease [Flavobacterium saliperosum]ESU22995.1 NUMOD4 domain-containing protein [Flavobacterium saliperosum S13]SCX17782.1 NUMOD4 motif-containing protein [Flavobacterium saliperosum]